MANRLGYPIFGVSPFEKILGFEFAPNHPGYQFQPFVQTPSIDPDPSLCFEKGEVIYENTRVGEWVRMWRMMFGIILPFYPMWYTFEIYANDGAPSLEWLSEAGFWQRTPMQGQDGGDWELEKVRYCDDHDYMNMIYAQKRIIVRPWHTMY